MKEILVICRNCGEVERYDENYMTPIRKQWHNCRMCGNRTHDYKTNRRWANQMVKRDHQETIDYLKEDKYNSKVFGIHKGFDYRKCGD